MLLLIVIPISLYNRCDCICNFIEAVHTVGVSKSKYNSAWLTLAAQIGLCKNVVKLKCGRCAAPHFALWLYKINNNNSCAPLRLYRTTAFNYCHTAMSCYDLLCYAMLYTILHRQSSKVNVVRFTYTLSRFQQGRGLACNWPMYKKGFFAISMLLNLLDSCILSHPLRSDMEHWCSGSCKKSDFQYIDEVTR